MSTNRKAAHLGSTASRFNAKVYKFLRDAKSELDPVSYTRLLDILSKYDSGISSLREARLEPSENYSDTLTQVEDTLQTSSKLTQSLNSMLPEQHHIGKIKYTEAVDFVDQIKEKAHPIYQPFIDTLKKYQNGEILLEELVSHIESLMQPFPDLLENFRLFIPTMSAKEPQSPSEEPEDGDESAIKADITKGPPRSERQEDVSPPPGRSESEAEDASQFGLQENNEHSIMLHGIKTLCPDQKTYKDILKLIQIYTLGIISIHELNAIIEDAFEDEQIERDKEKLVKLLASRNVSRRQQSWCCRPLADLVAASTEGSSRQKVECVRMGSYLMLPEEYPAVISTGRDPKLALEINDKWISVASGSEDFSFKVTRKNPYEEALCKCEDERFELDMAINYCESAISSLEKLLPEVGAACERGDTLFAYQKCTEGNLHRQLKKIFADVLESVLQQTKSNPKALVEVMIKIIRTHRDKHLQKKKDQNQLWKEDCEKNFAKSLDHRAFYFRQSEKKNTNTKAFLLEIRSRYDKRTAETTPDLVKKGGTISSVYYNSVPMLVPEPFHTIPVEHDDVAKLGPAYSPLYNLATNREVKKYASKLPQFQLLFDRRNAFDEAYRLVLDQIVSSHTAQPDQDHTKAFFTRLMEDFFCCDCAHIDSAEGEGFTEDDIRVAMSENFLTKRLEHGEMALAETWGKVREEVAGADAKGGEESKSADAKKAKPVRLPKTTRGGHNKKMDKKGDNNGKGVVLFDRGLAKSPVKEPSEPMELLHQKGKKIEDALFLPTATSDHCNVMYGTADFYSFFRHFHCLYERLIKARTFAGKALEADLEKRPELATKFSALLGKKRDELKTERYEQVYLKGLYAYLRGNIDAAKYEDFCRHTLGPQGYLLFTMDKLISAIVKIIQGRLVEDEVSSKVMDLYVQQKQQRLPELLYYTYFNRLAVDILAGGAVNSFRAFYNQPAQVLSIHHYVSPYSHVDYAGLKEIHRCVDSSVAGVSRVKSASWRGRAYLPRNVKATRKRADRTKRLVLSNHLAHITMGETNSWKVLYSGEGEDAIVLQKKRIMTEDERTSKAAEKALVMEERLAQKQKKSVPAPAAS